MTLTTTMEDIAFSDWPGQPMDLSGSNPWLPAYGFQHPTALLEKDDFLGHPDADLFLHGSAGQHYVYLETIQEETSDDLRSESDISESRASPAGWLATDSESGSVIRIHTLGTFDSSSEREIACPSKRRKQDNLLCVSDDESNQSLSRSSSLIQFESLERQCQDISSSSPSVFSNFSYDSLENQNRNCPSPDRLEKSYNSEPEPEYNKSLKIEHKGNQKDEDIYNRYSGSDSNESTESEDTLETAKYGSCKSINNLKTWRSFDGLHPTNNITKTSKVSAENLSEDSGYSDHFYQYNKNKSSSIPNIAMLTKSEKSEQKFTNNSYLEKYRLKNCKGFDAYDGDIFQNFSGNFGVSYQDLSALDKYEFYESRSPLIDRFIKNNVSRKISNAALNIEAPSESIRSSSKYNQQTSSEPNLLSNNRTVNQKVCEKQDYFVEGCVFICSVPKDLNLAGELKYLKNSWTFISETISIATKNFDLADLKKDIDEERKMERKRGKKKSDRISLSLKQKKSPTPPSDVSSETDIHYKREGSYLEAMENMVNMSDDEHNPCYRDKTNRSTIVEFDKKILKAISEQSVQASMTSLGSVKDTLDILFLQPISSQNRNVKSTPNLATYNIEEHDDANKRNSMLEMPRKSSFMNQSTATSSENDDKTLTSTKSFNGSTNSKGVHFCPVVSEVNWRDSASTEKESSYSLSSTPRSSPPKLIRPEPRLPERIYASEPELQMVQTEKSETVKLRESDMEYTFVPLKPRYSISQPNISKPNDHKVCKETDNELMYVDSDGVAYKHTHLGNIYKSSPTTNNNNNTTTTSTTTTTISSSGHVASSARQEVNATKPVSVMEPAVTRRDSKSAGKSGKLGGFFSRIASFRFTKGKNSDKSKAKKRLTEVKNVENMTGQRLATKEDYIYIPLKGPLAENNRKCNNNGSSKTQIDCKQNENACISAKPPLPKLPPRVVGASVKKRLEATALQITPERCTIDSGDSLPQPMEPMGLIETDLDTEVTVITSGAHVKTRSLMNLGAEAPPRSLAAPPHPNRPHKSMEFLLDKQNLKVVEPPENELQKGERVMSEHQLRVERSLQKLTVPDWYKQSEVPREGFLLKKSPCRETRWTGTNSKTTSLSSLGSSTQSPTILSPTPQNQPFVRWSTSKLNSSASSPCASTRSSFNARQPNGSISPSSLRSSFSYRQPYMGWRSQERLSRPRTPAERLASTILNQNHQQPPQPQESPEIQTSIKEVTSAIVHYVSGLKPENGRDLGYDSQETASHRSRSVSPRGSQKLCWLESSFVGTRPLDSPQTPVTLSESQTSTPVPPSTLRLDLQTHNGESIHA